MDVLGPIYPIAGSLSRGGFHWHQPCNSAFHTRLPMAMSIIITQPMEMKSMHDPKGHGRVGISYVRSSIIDRRARVLIGDDDRLLRRRMAQALRADGHDVVEAHDGEELLALIASEALRRERAKPFDLIVAGAEMRGVNGLWILASLRSVDWTTPFVLLADDVNDRKVTESRRLGVAAILQKPLALRPLRDAVTNILGAVAEPESLAVGM